MDPWNPTENSRLARRLLRTEEAGVLSTISLELPGYPFGSVTPYAMTHEGEVAILVSTIAQHTANIDADPRVCLTVVERGDASQQALARVSLVGDAERVPAERVARVGERYFGFFPAARDYGETHDFAFYWLRVRRVRSIAGFGRIAWIEPDEWRVPAPEWGPAEAGIVEHMNQDHAEFVSRIARSAGLADAGQDRFIACDPEGCHVRSGSALAYVPFAEPALTESAMRAAVRKLV